MPLNWGIIEEVGKNMDITTLLIDIKSDVKQMTGTVKKNNDWLRSNVIQHSRELRDHEKRITYLESVVKGVR